MSTPRKVWKQNKGPYKRGTGAARVRKMCWYGVPELDPDFNIEDAKEPWVVTPRRQDLKKAIPCDALRCFWALASLFFGRPGIIFPSVAYIRKDRKTVEKFVCPPVIRKSVKMLDKGADVTDLDGLTAEFRPPEGNKRVGARNGEGGQGEPGKQMTEEEWQGRYGKDSRFTSMFVKMESAEEAA